MAVERISYGPDPNQFGELRLPVLNGPHAAAIVIHGGFWRAAYGLDHISLLAGALPDLGIAAWNIEYRRLGHPGGGWPGTLEDVANAARFLREIAPGRHIDPDRVIAIGHSAGGHLALWLAASRRIALRGVVSLAGVADLRRAFDLRLGRDVVREFLGATPGEAPERYRDASPIERVPLGVRQRLIHGERDDIVPIEIARRHVDAARKQGDDARLVALEDAGHFEVIDPGSSVWPRIEAAIRELTGSPG